MVRQTPQKGAAVARRKRRDHSGDADPNRPRKIYDRDDCDDESQHQLEMQGQKNESPVDYRPASSKYQAMPPPSSSSAGGGCSAMSTVGAVGTTSVASATRAVGAMRKSGYIGCSGRSEYSAYMGCNNCCECNEYSAQQVWRVR